LETTLCAEEVGALEDGVFEADVLEVEALEADSFKLEAELTAVLEAEPLLRKMANLIPQPIVYRRRGAGK